MVISLNPHLGSYRLHLPSAFHLGLRIKLTEDRLTGEKNSFLLGCFFPLGGFISCFLGRKDSEHPFLHLRVRKCLELKIILMSQCLFGLTCPATPHLLNNVWGWCHIYLFIYRRGAGITEAVTKGFKLHPWQVTKPDFELKSNPGSQTCSRCIVLPLVGKLMFPQLLFGSLSPGAVRTTCTLCVIQWRLILGCWE